MSNDEEPHGVRTPLERVEHQGLDLGDALEVGHSVGGNFLYVRDVDKLALLANAEPEANVVAAVEDREAVLCVVVGGGGLFVFRFSK